MTTITLPVPLPILTFSILVLIIMLSITYGLVRSDGPKSKARFIRALIPVAFSALFFVFIAGFWEYMGLIKPVDSIYYLGVTPLFAIAYLLMALNAIAFAKWKNDGDVLRPVWGLHFWLRTGFGFGLFLGVVSWIIIDFFVKPDFVSSRTTFETLIICMGAGLTLGYLLGVIFGWRAEFRGSDY